MFGEGPLLVVAPHPDDEVLGVGGTIARLAAQGREVYVVIVTRADPAIFPDYSLEEGRGEAMKADDILGVRKTIFLEGFPAALLDTVPQSALNAALQREVDQIDPEFVFVPYPGDLHRDHRVIAEAALVATRPNKTSRIRGILAYETLSETNWNAFPLTSGFVANTYVDISDFLDAKMGAMRAYKSQVKPFPHERSLEAIEALARTRGATAGVKAAEAFALIRQTYR